MSATDPTPWGVSPWVLDAGTGRELEIDFVTAESGGRTLGETYDYTVGLRTPHEGADDTLERYHELFDRERYAGDYTLHDPINGRTEYTETCPDDAATLLVRLEPTDPLTSTVPGLWGLIEDISTEDTALSTGQGGTNIALMTLSLVYLADIDEYATREAITDDLEHPGLF